MYKYLFSKETGKYTVKIIHFGSTAKGERSEGRDIEVWLNLP